MKIIILNTFDLKGGAARATFRLHSGLRKLGVDSQMIVLKKESDLSSVVAIGQGMTFAEKLQLEIGTRAERLPLKFYRNRTVGDWSVGWFPNRVAAHVSRYSPDLVHLTWVSNGYLPIPALSQINRPLVWRMPDFWAMTGGCHYPQDCTRYMQQCGACPLLHSHNEHDLSRRTWERKARHWRSVNLTIVTPSHWLASCVKKSGLLSRRRVEVIPNGLDISEFRPIDKPFARHLFNLSQDKKIVLFGAIKSLKDQRKGSGYLQQALKKLAPKWGDRIELAIFGASMPDSPQDFGFRTHYLGNVSDNITLALIYSAADVMVVPSLQEVFGQTASESIACGTPVIAFAGTGLADIIDHQQNGYLAQPFEVGDLAAGIEWVLEDDERHAQLSRHARRKAEAEFDILKTADRYKMLYEDILTAGGATPR